MLSEVSLCSARSKNNNDPRGQARIEWVLLEIFSGVSLNRPSKKQPKLCRKSPLSRCNSTKNSIRTHSIPACCVIVAFSCRSSLKRLANPIEPMRSSIWNPPKWDQDLSLLWQLANVDLRLKERIPKINEINHKNEIRTTEQWQRAHAHRFRC